MSQSIFNNTIPQNPSTQNNYNFNQNNYHNRNHNNNSNLFSFGFTQNTQRNNKNHNNNHNNSNININDSQSQSINNPSIPHDIFSKIDKELSNLIDSNEFKLENNIKLDHFLIPTLKTIKTLLDKKLKCMIQLIHEQKYYKLLI